MTKATAEAYQAMRAPDDPFADYPERVSYLIDADGVIQKAYKVGDPGAHAAEVLADLDTLG